jgi:hypothetical protein
MGEFAERIENKLFCSANFSRNSWSLFIRSSVTLLGEIPTAAVATGVVDAAGEEGAKFNNNYRLIFIL